MLAEAVGTVAADSGRTLGHRRCLRWRVNNIPIAVRIVIVVAERNRLCWSRSRGGGCRCRGLRRWCVMVYDRRRWRCQWGLGLLTRRTLNAQSK